MVYFIRLCYICCYFWYLSIQFCYQIVHSYFHDFQVSEFSPSTSTPMGLPTEFHKQCSCSLERDYLKVLPFSYAILFLLITNGFLLLPSTILYRVELIMCIYVILILGPSFDRHSTVGPKMLH